tara:strand:+ start:71 stop:436 length:366 start_codon:yes stop_codon:yes gene_type:complete
MGRYYSGDIEGKFMFAVQSSDAPERFGAVESNPGYIDYYVPPDATDEIRNELDSITSLCGDQILRVQKMFDENMHYNDETMKEYGVTEEGLSEYADYQLGKQILEYLEENPDCGCNIQAEL